MSDGTSDYLRVVDIELLRTVPISKWPEKFLLRHAPLAYLAAGYCTGGHWPVTEYGELCPSCVMERTGEIPPAALAWGDGAPLSAGVPSGAGVSRPGPLPAGHPGVALGLRASEAGALVESAILSDEDPLRALERWQLQERIVLSAREILSRASRLQDGDTLSSEDISVADLRTIDDMLTDAVHGLDL